MEIKQHAPEKPMGQKSNQKKNKKYIETNEKWNITHQNSWDATKAVLRGKYIVINAYNRKKKKSLNKQLYTLRN